MRPHRGSVGKCSVLEKDGRHYRMVNLALMLELARILNRCSLASVLFNTP
jgi:hypothetical protein